MFSSALASGQLGPLMNQFGLPADAVEAANKGGGHSLTDSLSHPVTHSQSESHSLSHSHSVSQSVSHSHPHCEYPTQSLTLSQSY